MESSTDKLEEVKEEGKLSSSSPSWSSPFGMVAAQYRRIKENAETYPYVWGSYTIVYGGFGLWFTYRWRKLRRTETRVKVLQDKLRKLVESEETSTTASTSIAKPNITTAPSSTVDKPSN
ncbi:uncharacterized protein LOC124940163 [Impatiens glandulifera]|uniref:uncharacterized protein LOC124940163 n=1 Tax=Impatiens glandulifera TaxID=253017 RepID=UPI001FB19254|nr:uncharacterized protein LOC124940163 [Impatiens glandulifera]